MMSQTIGWRKVIDNKTSEWAETPKWFDGKWTGRSQWYLAMFDGEVLEWDVCTWSGNGYYRPKDFQIFRRSLDNITDEEIRNEHWPTLNIEEVRDNWKECTDWLEANLDVYVDFG